MFGWEASSGEDVPATNIHGNLGASSFQQICRTRSVPHGTSCERRERGRRGARAIRPPKSRKKANSLSELTKKAGVEMREPPQKPPQAGAEKGEEREGGRHGPRHRRAASCGWPPPLGPGLVVRRRVGGPAAPMRSSCGLAPPLARGVGGAWGGCAGELEVAALKASELLCRRTRVVGRRTE